jgi:hypothetical protein
MSYDPEYHKAYYLKHKEELLAKQREHYKTNKESIQEYQKEWYKANKSTVQKRSKAFNVKTRYGLSMETYEKLLSRGCDICGTKEGKLCCDHNHQTGAIRGCLCDSCNKALGHLSDSLENAKKLVQYLEVHNV